MSRSNGTAADKDIEQGSFADDMSPDERLRNVLTNSMTLSPETFERLYLAPKAKVSGQLRNTFANPTPVALLGFSVALFPLSTALMGWRGAGGNAIATTGASIWFGGVLLFLAGIGEFLLGNAFPMIVFFGYGAHFFTFATTFIPWFNAVGFYAASTQGTVGEGLSSPAFAASFGYYPLALAMLSFVYLIGSIRTNAVFVTIFLTVTLGFSLAAGGFWQIAQGAVSLGGNLLVGSGACFFVADLCGWYLLLSIMIQVMELPIPDLPVFDLSTVIKARPRGGPKQD